MALEPGLKANSKASPCSATQCYAAKHPTKRLALMRKTKRSPEQAAAKIWTPAHNLSRFELPMSWRLGPEPTPSPIGLIILCRQHASQCLALLVEGLEARRPLLDAQKARMHAIDLRVRRDLMHRVLGEIEADASLHLAVRRHHRVQCQAFRHREHRREHRREQFRAQAA